MTVSNQIQRKKVMNYSIKRKPTMGDPCSCCSHNISTRYLVITRQAKSGPHCESCADNLLLHCMAIEVFDQENEDN
ncbi:hypothetical protein BH18THE2_BH18THE2_27670 [soil metagenome]